jgi:hypothetical protein
MFDDLGQALRFISGARMAGDGGTPLRINRSRERPAGDLPDAKRPRRNRRGLD